MKKTTLFILAASGMLFTNAQNNLTWQEKNISPADTSRYGVLELVARDENSIWGLLYPEGQLLGANNYFIRSSNGGNTWHKIASPYPGFYVNGLASVDSLTAYYVISDWNPGNADNHVIKTTNGGQSWTESYTVDSSIIPTHVYFFNANEGIIVCDPKDGYWTIYRTTDAGQNWNRVITDSIYSAPLANEFGGTFIFDAEGDHYWFLTGIGSGTPSRVFYTSDKGQSWNASSTIGSNTQIRTAALTFRDSQHGLLRCNEFLFKTSDHGATWTPVTVASGTMFTYDMCHVPGTNMFISTGGDLSSAGHSLHGIGTSYTTDDGTTWHTIDTAVSHTAILFTGAQQGWTGGLTRTGGLGGAFKATWPATGINETEMEHADVTVYPNPVNDDLTVQLEGVSQRESLSYAIMDLAGRMVESGKVHNGEKVDVSSLNAGMYFLNVSNGWRAGTVKLMKQ